MRFFYALFVIFLFIMCAMKVFASDSFYDLNSNLRRVGFDELKESANAKFESANYSLDPDFTLGYGDIVNINLWGKIEAVHKIAVDREGNITIPFVGKISVIGLTLDQARPAIKQELDKRYSNVEFDLSVADVQDIRVAVLGNVVNPGYYWVRPFSRITDVIIKAGGPNPNGSLSDIGLIRDEKKIGSFNLYDFLFKADQRSDLMLKHNDTVFIDNIKNIIAISGDVQYPGIYDTKDNIRLIDAIDEAGGMLPTKFKRKVIILRINSENKLMESYKDITFDASEMIGEKDNIVIENEDSIIVTTELDYTPQIQPLYKKVYLTGQFKMPGSYIVKENDPLSSLIKKAGLKDGVFIKGAVFTREVIKNKQKSILDELVKSQQMALLEEESRLSETIITEQERQMRTRALENRKKVLNLMALRIPEGRIVINMEDIINGKTDILLEDGDNLFVPSMPDWVLVVGAVYNPNSIVFEEGKPMEYYLNTVGGANKLADKDNVYTIKADGSAKSQAIGIGEISRGDIIVVPEKAKE